MFLFFHKHTYLLCILIIFVVSSTFSQTADTVVENESSTNADTVLPQFDEENAFFLDDTDTQAIEVKPFGVWNTIKIFLVLIVLLLVGVGLVWLLKRMQVSHSSSNEEVIDIVSSKVIAQGASLHVVKLGTGYLLVSSTSNSVNLIKDYEAKEDLDEITLAISKAESVSKEGAKKSFVQSLQEKLSNNNTQIILNQVSQNNSVLSLFRGSDKGKK